MSSMKMLRTLFMSCSTAGLLASSVPVMAQEPIVFTMKKGEIADYGATPWYTDDISVGNSIIKFALDNGTYLLWATSDECQTFACDPHNKVDQFQDGFEWIDKTDRPVNFGPWGEMQVWTGKVPFIGHSTQGIVPDLDLEFSASVHYEGSKFETLAWDGGMGFPSESASVVGNDFYFQALIEETGLPAMYSTYTDADTGRGAFILGGLNAEILKPKTRVELEPAKPKGIAYLWGTPLSDLSLGEKSIYTDEIFIIDSGSSHFKGDGKYIYPVLNALLEYKDSNGDPIFEKVMEKVNQEDSSLTWTGLKYIKGGPADYPELANLSIDIGQNCDNRSDQQLRIEMSPEQYSYKVEKGERVGEWVIAFHLLDGVGGLLVGSTFMDLVHVTFNYDDSVDGVLSQGQMQIHDKTEGSRALSYSCVQRG